MRDTVLTIELERWSLDSVQITADRSGRSLPVINRLQIGMERLLQAPAFLGERDLLKSLALMPGVSLGIEGSSGLQVRGGTPDQNLMLLDGAKVYNATHLLGLISVFPADALHSAELYKGGFPAQYGGRLGSVLDIRLREGRQDRFSGEAGLGLLNSRITLEGPAGKRSSLLLTGRYAYLNLLSLPLRLAYQTRQANSLFSYHLYDGTLKFNCRFDGGGRLYLSGYAGQDAFGARERSGSQTENQALTRWMNQTLSARYTRPLGSRSFASIQAAYTRYRFLLGETERTSIRPDSVIESAVRSRSGIEEGSASAAWDWYLAPALTLQTGVQLEYQVFTPVDQFSYTSLLPGPAFRQDTSMAAWTAAAWVEASGRKGPLEYSAGLRGSRFASGTASWLYPEFRGSASLLLSERLRLSGSWGNTAQPVHLLTSTNLGLPGDIWIPANALLPPQRGYQASSGLSFRSRNSQYTASAEVYFRRSRHLIQYQAPVIDLGTVVFQDYATRIRREGEGRAYGLELLLNKAAGTWTGWMSYTLAWSEIRFGSGPWQPALYEQRHLFSLAAARRIAPRWNLSAAWVFQSGRPVYLPVGQYLGPDGNYVLLYGSEPDRLPAYHRLDLSLEHVRQTAKGRQARWRIGAYNCYNRANPIMIDIRPDRYQMVNGVSTVIEGGVYGRAFLPILPFFDYSWKF